MGKQSGKGQDHRRGHRAFTVLELLVVFAIIAMLLTIVLPAMQACRRASRGVKCLSQLRTAAYEFRLFADDFAARTRGDSAVFGPSKFKIEDFQDSLYRVNEFWDLPHQNPTPYDASRELMMCPEGPRELVRHFFHTWPNGPDFVSPRANVSLAFNKRLYKRVRIINGNPYLVNAFVTSKILDHPNVPLLMDVDGKAAVARDRPPYYIAPPIDPDDPYGAGDHWFPSFRHHGSINIAFVGGHVLSSDHPLSQAGWDWSYQPSE